jgi:hypothetical protein
MTAERIDGPPTITLDAAQEVVIAALEGRLTTGRVGFGWTTVENVEDAGAVRHERCVAFDPVLPDGTRKTFIATIEEWGT